VGAVQPDKILGTHPVWHYALGAAGSVGVFVGIKVHERWRRVGRPAGGLVPHRSSRREGVGWIVIVVALSSFSCSAIHGSVSGDHFREWALFGVFFVVASTLQAAWAVAVLVRPRRLLFVLGAAGNLSVVVLWTVTRTVGLPVGPEVWRPEAVSPLDAVATGLELAIVLGASWLIVRGRRSPGLATPRPGAALVA
jgi:hypothetical protein